MSYRLKTTGQGYPIWTWQVEFMVDQQEVNNDDTFPDPWAGYTTQQRMVRNPLLQSFEIKLETVVCFY